MPQHDATAMTAQQIIRAARKIAAISRTGTAITIRALKKTYGERIVLHEIDLTIPSGEFVAVIGRSGCGKTTLLRLLAGLEKPDAGEIKFGADDARIRINEARVVFQEPRLLPWRSVLQNVALGLDGSGRERARKILERVGLGERLDDWPTTLSGGQRQRVALARALVHQPRLLLLDEPFGALDALTRIEMHALLRELCEALELTAVLVTHDVSEAVMLADRVIMLETGGIVMDRPVPIVRPRNRDQAMIGRIEQEILDRLLATHE